MNTQLNVKTVRFLKKIPFSINLQFFLYRKLIITLNTVFACKNLKDQTVLFEQFSLACQQS